ncbi:uncharacterized protein [Diadema setosum]|uniref:uncharacterized protein n=1 Tax=Diadema setosum TaxID=31175 RepID=UPI003B3AF237
MAAKKPAGKLKQGDGPWANRLRAASPVSHNQGDPRCAGDQPSETFPLTMDYVKEALQSQIKEALCCDDVLQKLNDVISAAILEKVSQSVYQAISLDLEQLTAEQKSMNEQLKYLEGNLKKVQNALDEQEQYSRWECLRFYGIPETADENTDNLIMDVVKTHLDISLDPTCISRSHRITPKPRSGVEGDKPGPKPIIVKFGSYNARQTVFNAKSRFKGSPIFVHEDLLLCMLDNLTSHRRKLVQAAKDRSSVRRVWTKDGKITALVRTEGMNDRRVTIRNMADIERLR